MNISFSATRAQVDPNTYNKITVDIDGADKYEILDHFEISDILSHFSIEAILDKIGENECIDHFDLQVNPEQ